MNTILNYERFGEDLWRHVRTFEDEKVLVCHAFRWRLNGKVISNGYEMFSPETICRDNKLEIIARISDELLIVKPTDLGGQPNR